MTAQLMGNCRKCGEEVRTGDRFDMERWHVGADFRGDLRTESAALWHRDCNPRADHSKDGETA